MHQNYIIRVSKQRFLVPGFRREGVHQMSEPVSIRYKCKFCGNQQNKSLRSGPPNPGVCLKAPEDGKGWHGPHKWVAVPH